MAVVVVVIIAEVFGIIIIVVVFVDTITITVSVIIIIVAAAATAIVVGSISALPACDAVLVIFFVIYVFDAVFVFIIAVPLWFGNSVPSIVVESSGWLA